MPSVFDVLGRDHQEVKRMLSELESGPTAATGANDNHLMLRKKMVEELIIEESKHEALEEMYFWPAVRDHLADGDQLADTAVAQEQEGKEVLDRLDKLNADQPEFEELVFQFVSAWGSTRLRGDPGVAAPARHPHRGRGRQHRRQDRRGQEDGPDPPAPEHPALTRRAQGRRSRGSRGRPAPRCRQRPGPGLTERGISGQLPGNQEESVTTSETGQVTGTADKDYNIIWYTEHCLDNTLRLETFIQDAERSGDSELAEFFRKAQADSRKGAELGKRMLASRLAG